jgi:hypothetical protein
MFKDTKEGQTNYCEKCEKEARQYLGYKNIEHTCGLPLKEKAECCEKGCLKHKYHCGVCNFSLTYSPANYCSRPSDIPNPCENCKVEEKAECWEDRFDLEMDDCLVVHVYDTDQFKKMKEFVRKELQQAKQEARKEGFDSAKTWSDYADKTYSVSVWAELGKERGYWSYFRDLIRCEFQSEMEKWIEGLRKDITTAVRFTYNDGYNQALADLKAKLNDMQK